MRQQNVKEEGAVERYAEREGEGFESAKTKSIRGLEEKMSGIAPGSLRYQVLEGARDFKNSWIALGRLLYTVWKDKLYRGWGFLTFDAYIKQEIGIKKLTAMKLLRSYYFLEQEEPQYLKASVAEDRDVATIAPYESIDVLRLAKNKSELDQEDYAHFKQAIFERGKDFREVRKELTALIRERKETSPQEALELRRMNTVKRLLGTLRSLRQEIEVAKLVPHVLIKETAELIRKIEAEIS
ncbi:MAG: hypothetical protein C4540_03130 [Candidatus Omnitrophota bacterium]|nr:MAG: hypothetical protein C4540_03130 [Candidatus Omnitrophota bacterium]